MCSPHLGAGRAWAGERLERLVQRLLVDLVAVGRNELRERKPATACRGRVSDAPACAIGSEGQGTRAARGAAAAAACGGGAKCGGRDRMAGPGQRAG